MSLNTAKEMASIIVSSSRNPQIRAWAEYIVSPVRDKDDVGEVQSIYNFLQAYTRYGKDPIGYEYIQTPPYVLARIELGERPSLDCDDYTVLGLSLLRALGYEVLIRLASYSPTMEFEHVYGLVYLPEKKKWVAFDPIRKEKPFGWEAPGPTALRDVEVP